MLKGNISVFNMGTTYDVHGDQQKDVHYDVQESVHIDVQNDVQDSVLLRNRTWLKI